MRLGAGTFPELAGRDRKRLAAYTRSKFDPLVSEVAADGRELSPVLT